MRKSVTEIGGIEIEIRRIAINATLRAAHLGGMGNALNTIAEAISRQVGESSRNTNDAAATLDSMRVAAHEVACDGPGVSGNELTDAGVAMDEMRQAIRELHSSMEASFSRMTQIAEMGGELGEQIQAVLEGMTVGRVFGDVVRRARAELERIGADALEVGGEDPLSGRLERFAHQYTMQAERDVHREVVGVAATEEAVLAGAPEVSVIAGGGGEDDLGDNVELF